MSDAIRSNIIIQTTTPQPDLAGFASLYDSLEDIQKQLDTLSGKTYTINLATSGVEPATISRVAKEAAAQAAAATASTGPVTLHAQLDTSSVTQSLKQVEKQITATYDQETGFINSIREKQKATGGNADITKSYTVLKDDAGSILKTVEGITNQQEKRNQAAATTIELTRRELEINRQRANIARRDVESRGGKLLPTLSYTDVKLAGKNSGVEDTARVAKVMYEEFVNGYRVVTTINEATGLTGLKIKEVVSEEQRQAIILEKQFQLYQAVTGEARKRLELERQLGATISKSQDLTGYRAGRSVTGQSVQATRPVNIFDPEFDLSKRQQRTTSINTLTGSVRSRVDEIKEPEDKAAIKAVADAKKKATLEQAELDREERREREADVKASLREQRLIEAGDRKREDAAERAALKRKAVADAELKVNENIATFKSKQTAPVTSKVLQTNDGNKAKLVEYRAQVSKTEDAVLRVNLATRQTSAYIETNIERAKAFKKAQDDATEAARQTNEQLAANTAYDRRVARLDRSRNATQLSATTHTDPVTGQSHRESQYVVRDNLRNTESLISLNSATQEYTTKIQASAKARKQNNSLLREEIDLEKLLLNRQSAAGHRQESLNEGFTLAGRKTVTTPVNTGKGRTGQQTNVDEYYRVQTEGIGRYTVALRTVDEATGKLTERTLTGGAAVRYLGDTFLSSVRKVLVWTAATTAIFLALGAIKQTIASSIELEKTTVLLARVGRNLGTTDQQRAIAARSLTSEIIDLSSAIGANAFEAQKAATVFLRSGQNQREALLSVRAALLAAKIAELDVVAAAELLSAAMLQFNLRASDLLPTLNTLNSLSNNYRVTTDDLLQSISRTGSVVEEQGGRLSELAAITTILSQRTSRSGAEIGNAIKTIASRLVSPDLQATAFEKMGLVFRNVDGSSKTLSTTLLDLQHSFDTVTASERDSLTVQIAGVRQRNLLIAAVEGAVDSVIAEVRSLQDSNSAVDESKQNISTLSSALERLQNTLLYIVNSGLTPFSGALKVAVNDIQLFLSLLTSGLGSGAIKIAAFTAVMYGLYQVMNAYVIPALAAIPGILRSIITRMTTAATVTGGFSSALRGISKGAVAGTVAMVGLGLIFSRYAELRAAHQQVLERAAEIHEREAIAADKQATATRVATEAIISQIQQIEKLNRLKGKGAQIERVEGDVKRIADAANINLPIDLNLKDPARFKDSVQAILAEANKKAAVDAEIQVLHREKQIFALRKKTTDNDIKANALREKADRMEPNEHWYSMEQFDKIPKTGGEFLDQLSAGVGGLWDKGSIDQGHKDAAETFRGQANELDAELAKATEEVTRLQNEIKDLKKGGDAFKSLTTDVTGLQHELITSHGTLMDIVDNVIPLNKAIGAATGASEVEMLDKQIALLGKAIQDTETDFNNLQKALGESLRPEFVEAFTKTIKAQKESLQQSITQRFQADLKSSIERYSASLKDASKIRTARDVAARATTTGGSDISDLIGEKESLAAQAKELIQEIPNTTKLRAQLKANNEENKKAYQEYLALKKTGFAKGIYHGDEKPDGEFTVDDQSHPINVALEKANDRLGETYTISEGLKKKIKEAESVDPAKASANRKQIAEDLDELAEKEVELAIKLLATQKQITNEQKKSTEELRKSLGVMSEEDKLRLRGHLAYFQANPNAKVGLDELLSMDSADAGLIQSYFAQHLKPASEDTRLQEFQNVIRTPEQVEQEKKQKEIDDVRAGKPLTRELSSKEQEELAAARDRVDASFDKFGERDPFTGEVTDRRNDKQKATDAADIARIKELTAPVAPISRADQDFLDQRTELANKARDQAKRLRGNNKEVPEDQEPVAPGEEGDFSATVVVDDSNLTGLLTAFNDAVNSRYNQLEAKLTKQLEDALGTMKAPPPPSNQPMRMAVQ